MTSALPATSSIRISPADVDQDGDLDLVYSTSGQMGNLVLTRENLGAFQFAALDPLFDVQLRAAPADVLPVDWDLDGDIDFVYSKLPAPFTGAGGVAWVESFGGQSFAHEATIAAVDERVFALTLVDFDGDLAPDLIGFEPDRRALVGLLNEQEVGNVYCASTANSTGSVASLAATGSSVVSLNALQLAATDMPPNVFGFFLGATAPDQVPGAGGTAGVLCLGGQIGRYSRANEIRNSGPSGSFALTLDLTDLRTPSGSTSGAVGQTWYFQAWFRDANPAPTSNLTSALSVTLR